jgi:hypothetical protein
VSQKAGFGGVEIIEAQQGAVRGAIRQKLDFHSPKNSFLPFIGFRMRKLAL